MHGLANVPTDEPVLLLPNHHNALLDPLLVAVFSNRKPFFLTRADVFTSGFIKSFYAVLQMIPIYRIRDGRDSLSKNEVIFDECAAIFKENKAILLFPEANHSLRRSVRPLSKGFTRILFNALEKNKSLDIKAIPVGINYKNGAGFPDSVDYYFGNPIAVREMYDAGDLRASTVRVKEVISTKLKNLTTHISDSEHYDEIISHLNAKGVDYSKPQEVNSMVAHWSQSEINTTQPTQQKKPKVFTPWDLLFRLLNFPILLIWKVVSKARVQEEEFRSTVRFIFSMLCFPLFYLLLYLIITYFWDYEIGLLIILAHFTHNLLYVKLR